MVIWTLEGVNEQLPHSSSKAFVRSGTLTTSVLIHPKDVLSSTPNSSNKVQTLLCALGQSHAGIEKGFSKTVPTKLDA